MEKLNLPIGGPTTWSEALADLEESERELLPDRALHGSLSKK